jgi:hypothetical protein
MRVYLWHEGQSATLEVCTKHLADFKILKPNIMLLTGAKAMRNI